MKKLLWIVVLLLGVGDVLTARAAEGPMETVGMSELYQMRVDEDRVYRLAENPRLLIFDFADLARQGAAFNRMAAFLEKRGTVDKILDDRQLEARIAEEHTDANHFFLGHDYRISDVARFFNTAWARNVPLNGAEQQVRQRLVEMKFLHSGAQGELEGEPEAALIAVAQGATQADALHTSLEERTLLLRHELSHGEFLTNPAYRGYCQEFWQRLTADERQIFLQELAHLGYESAHESLMVNEMQAYLWEPVKGGFLQMTLVKQGKNDFSALRSRFLAGLMERSQPVTAFFDLPQHRDLLPVANHTGKRSVIRKISG
ncbi:MAG: hypothetical protein H7834_12940 [Magnetococcus sp. YQC-9]